MVKLFQNKEAASGPSSAIGIMRFFDAQTKGPQITPEFVIIVAIAFCILVLVIHAIGVF